MARAVSLKVLGGGSTALDLILSEKLFIPETLLAFVKVLPIEANSEGRVCFVFDGNAFTSRGVTQQIISLLPTVDADDRAKWVIVAPDDIRQEIKESLDPKVRATRLVDRSLLLSGTSKRWIEHDGMILHLPGSSALEDHPGQ